MEDAAGSPSTKEARVRSHKEPHLSADQLTPPSEPASVRPTMGATPNRAAEAALRGTTQLALLSPEQRLSEGAPLLAQGLRRIHDAAAHSTRTSAAESAPNYLDDS